MNESEIQVVFGAGGGAGNAVVRRFAAEGAHVRAVTRSGRAEVPEGVENVRGTRRIQAPFAPRVTVHP